MSEWPSKQQEIWFQAGVTGEQGRIIKLLEDKRHHIKCDCECDEELIALIKGEHK